MDECLNEKLQFFYSVLEFDCPTRSMNMKDQALYTWIVTLTT